MELKLNHQSDFNVMVVIPNSHHILIFIFFYPPNVLICRKNDFLSGFESSRPAFSLFRPSPSRIPPTAGSTIDPPLNSMAICLFLASNSSYNGLIFVLHFFLSLNNIYLVTFHLFFSNSPQRTPPTPQFSCPLSSSIAPSTCSEFSDTGCSTFLLFALEFSHQFISNSNSFFSPTSATDYPTFRTRIVCCPRSLLLTAIRLSDLYEYLIFWVGAKV